MRTNQPPPYAVGKSDDTAPSNIVHVGEQFYHAWYTIKKRKSVILSCLAFTIFIALFINFTQKPVYQSSAKIIFEAKPPNGLEDTWSVMQMLYDPTFLFTQVNLTQNPHFAEKVFEKVESPENYKTLLRCFGLHPSRKREEGKIFSDEEKRALKNAIRGAVSAHQMEKGVGVIVISVSGYERSILSQIANAAAETFIDLNYESNLESFQKSFLAISRSLSEVQEKIKIAETALKKIDSEIQLSQALKIYEEKHPLVIQLRMDIPALTEKLNQGSQNLQRLQVGQGKTVMSVLVTPHLDTESLSASEADLVTLKPLLDQEIITHKEMYNSIFKKLQELELSGGSKAWLGMHTLGAASTPSRPVHPDKKKNLIVGLLVGLFMGIGLAYFLEYLDSSMKTLEDISNYIKLFPLGLVPEVERNKPPQETPEGDLLPEDNQTSYWVVNDSDIPLYVTEAYKKIRTNLALGIQDTDLKVMQVTSAAKGEGKSTTTVNLGISLAEAGHRVLLVDGDMRRPTLHKILKFEGVDSGLSDYFAREDSWQGYILQTKTPNLYCLPAGRIPPNPAELLSTKRMQILVEELRANFDMILIDSPPTMSVADASIIASFVDGTICVFRAGFIPRHLCLQSRKTLETVNGKIVGCILNGVQTRSHSYYSYYSQYHDYYAAPAQKKVTPSEKIKGSFAELKGSARDLWKKIRVLEGPLKAYFFQGVSRLKDLMGTAAPRRSSEDFSKKQAVEKKEDKTPQPLA